MDEATGVGICHLAFILLYFGVVFTAITERNMLDISYAIFLFSVLFGIYAIFLSIYFVRIYIYKRKSKNSLLNR